MPATHVYVRHLSHPAVQRLKDPSGDDLRTPSYFDPEWIAANKEFFDVLHIHFGFEFYPVQRLRAVCDALDDAGIPLVYTAHDLRNPNHSIGEGHAAALDVWMERAAEIVTLTPWAADRIWERYRRRATVLPHPHVIELPRIATMQANRPRHWDGFRIGLHFKSKRPNMAGVGALRAALAATENREDLRLRMHVHTDVLDPGSPNYDRDLVDLAMMTVSDALSPLDLHIHRYAADDELWHFLSVVDAVVLPYIFGTHSGFLEACKDLGTSVIAPSCGGYGDQGAQHLFRADEKLGIDEADLTRAISEATETGRADPIPPETRATERKEIAEGHYELYKRMLTSRGLVHASLASAASPGPGTSSGW